MNAAGAMGSFGVIGAGSWGTALALQLARGGAIVRLWGRDPAQMARMIEQHENARYLPGVPFPPALEVQPDLARLLAEAGELLIAVPSHAFRETLGMLGKRGWARRICWATKGIEPGSGMLLHEVAAEMLAPGMGLAALSGPSFAREVARGLPTAITVAATDPAHADALAATLHSGAFRAYTSADLVGLGLGGAIKNVIAIAAGMSDGLGFGANSRAALVTRGLAEMLRLGRVLGARPETLMGLGGLGDLVLTCTDDQSRNRRFGLALAEGAPPDRIAAAIGQVVEGAWTAPAVRLLAQRHGVEMPISEQVARVLTGEVGPQAAVGALLERARKSELD